MAHKATLTALILAAGLGLALAASSCGSDDDNPTTPQSGSIVGLWHLTRVEETDERGRTTVSEGTAVPGHPSGYRFVEDGTGTWFEYGGFDPITWELQNGDLYIYYDDGRIHWIYGNYTITQSHWIVTTVWEQGGRRVQTYTRAQG